MIDEDPPGKGHRPVAEFGLGDTVASLAERRGISPRQLLDTFDEIGLPKASEDEPVFAEERRQLEDARQVESVAREMDISSPRLLEILGQVGVEKRSPHAYVSVNEQKQLSLAKTVGSLAEELGVSPTHLIGELEQIGVPKDSIDAYVSGDEQQQRHLAKSVHYLALDQGVSTDILLRLLERFGIPKRSTGALVTADEQERISPSVRVLKTAGAIKALRISRGLTRGELGERAGISERQLARIEAGEVDLTRDDRTAVRQITSLAAALRLPVKDLYGSTATARRVLHPEPRSEPTMPVSAAVSPQTRLGFALLRMRYGWTIAQVMEVAPLVFALVAEGSLARRQRRQRELEAACEQARPEIRSFLSDLRRQLAVEAASIDRRDLRDDDLEKGGDLGGPLRDGDLDPFCRHLFELARDLAADCPRETPAPPAHEPRRGERWLLAWMFREELNRAASTSERARWALEYGEANLFDMPQELRLDLQADLEEDAEDRQRRLNERVRWLEGKLSEEVEQAVRQWRDAFRTAGEAAGPRCPHCDSPVEPAHRFCPHCGKAVEVPNGGWT